MKWQAKVNGLERNIEILSCGLSDIDGNAVLNLLNGNAGMSSLMDLDWSGKEIRQLP